MENGTNKRSYKREKALMLFCALIAEMDVAVLNLINMFFINRWVGSDGSAAYELIMPYTMVGLAVIALSCNGMQAVCAKDHGAGDRDSFERHKNAGYSYTLAFMAVLMLLCFVFRSPLLSFLGAAEEGKAIYDYSRQCLLLWLPCFVLQSMFALASCLMYFEERKQLIIANIVLYSVQLVGNTLVTLTGPTLAGYMSINPISQGIADIYIFIVYFRLRCKGQESLSRFDRLNFRLADIREIFFTGLPDFMEYALVGALYYFENLYVLSRFSRSLLAGAGIFEAFENLPELLCVGCCFFVTAELGTRVGRITAADGENKAAAEKELHRTAVGLTKFAVIASVGFSLILILISKPVIGLFFSAENDPAALQAASWMTVSYAVGFVFYILNSEIVSYYKLVEAYSLAHIVFIAEALLLPLGAKILLGELFGVRGFCFGGALGEALVLVLNLVLVRIKSGHFPKKFQDLRLDKYLDRLSKRGAAK